jgi:alpha-mannosidase
VKATYKIADSVIEVVYTLDKYQSGVRIDITVDWKEVGGDIVPVLDYRIPVSYPVSGYLYDVPGAVVKRGDLTNDVPALQYGMAAGGGAESLILASDSKYGYRGNGNTLALTLINSSTSPDPYPERGIHPIRLLIGTAREDAGAAERMSACFRHKLFYQSSGSHSGSLPMKQSLLKMSAENIATTAVTAVMDGAVLIRGYNASGRKARAELLFAKSIASAEFVDLDEAPVKGVLAADGRTVTMEVDPYSIFEVKIRA